MTVLISKQSNVHLLTNLFNYFNVWSSARVKSEALICGKWTEGKQNLPDGLTWKSDGFKYLGVFLGDEATTQRNWEEAIEKVKGRLGKWKCITPVMSYSN